MALHKCLHLWNINCDPETLALKYPFMETNLHAGYYMRTTDVIVIYFLHILLLITHRGFSHKDDWFVAALTRSGRLTNPSHHAINFTYIYNQAPSRSAFLQPRLLPRLPPSPNFYKHLSTMAPPFTLYTAATPNGQKASLILGE